MSTKQPQQSSKSTLIDDFDEESISDDSDDDIEPPPTRNNNNHNNNNNNSTNNCATATASTRHNHKSSSSRQFLIHGCKNVWNYTSEARPQEPYLLQLWKDVILPDAIALPTAVEEFRAQLKAKTNQGPLIRHGIVAYLRPRVWELLSLVHWNVMRLESSIHYYRRAHKSVQAIVEKQTRKEIKNDLTRTLSSLPGSESIAQAAVERILLAFCIYAPHINYCQSMSHLVTFLLCSFDEEKTFWILCQMIDAHFPPLYFSPSLVGARTDAQIFTTLINSRLKTLAAHFNRFDIDLSVFALKCFLTLFVIVLPIESCARIWDLFFVEGNSIVFSILLAILTYYQDELVVHEDMASVLSFLSQRSRDLYDIDSIISLAYSNTCKVNRTDIDRMREDKRKTLQMEYLIMLSDRELSKHEEAAKKTKAYEAKRQLESEETSKCEWGVEIMKLQRYGKPKLTHIYLEKKLKNGRHVEGPKAKEELYDAEVAIAEIAKIKEMLSVNDISNGIQESNATSTTTPSPSSKRITPPQELEEDKERKLKYSANKLRQQLCDYNYNIRWNSQRKTRDEASIPLSNCELFIDASHGLFPSLSKSQRQQFDKVPGQCFSFISKERTLSIVFSDPETASLWRRVCKRTDIAMVFDCVEKQEEMVKEERRKARERLEEAVATPSPAVATKSPDADQDDEKVVDSDATSEPTSSPNHINVASRKHRKKDKGKRSNHLQPQLASDNSDASIDVIQTEHAYNNNEDGAPNAGKQHHRSRSKSAKSPR